MRRWWVALVLCIAALIPVGEGGAEKSPPPPSSQPPFRATLYSPPVGLVGLISGSGPRLHCEVVNAGVAAVQVTTHLCSAQGECIRPYGLVPGTPPHPGSCNGREVLPDTACADVWDTFLYDLPEFAAPFYCRFRLRSHRQIDVRATLRIANADAYHLLPAR